jgi:DMSO reductase family type II enzyme heme b subunit
MPAYADSIAVPDRWALAAYVRSFGPEEGRKPDEVVVARRVAALPATSDDDAWKDAPRARFEMFPNIVEPPRLFWASVESCWVQAAYTDTEVALRIQWDDRSHSQGTDTATVYNDRDGGIYHGTDHPDQFAVQFPVREKDIEKRPYFFFGDGRRPVSLWWWRADTNALQEMNGKGSGSLAPQDAESQALQGDVTHADGRYTMIMRRARTTPDTKRDVQFPATGSAFVPITFHAWDGYRGELGLRHSMTNWRWIYLEPEVDTGKLMMRSAGAGLATLLVLLGIVIWQRRKPDAPAEPEAVMSPIPAGTDA